MKTVMILASLAAVAISGNALALDIISPPEAYPVLLGGDPSGELVFAPLATLTLPPSAATPYGACRYNATWNFPTAVAPVLTAFCQFREAKRPPNNLNCSTNRTINFGTFVSTTGLICNGFDPSGALSPVIMALSEFSGGPGVGGMDGVATFDGLGSDFIQIG